MRVQAADLRENVPLAAPEVEYSDAPLAGNERRKDRPLQIEIRECVAIHVPVPLVELFHV